MTEFRRGDTLSVTLDVEYVGASAYVGQSMVEISKDVPTGVQTIYVPTSTLTLVKRRAVQVGDEIIFGLGDEPPEGTILSREVVGERQSTLVRVRVGHRWQRVVGDSFFVKNKAWNLNQGGQSYTVAYVPEQ